MELITSSVSPMYISRTIFCNKEEHYKLYQAHFGTELMYVYKNKSATYKVYLMSVSVLYVAKNLDILPVYKIDIR